MISITHFPSERILPIMSHSRMLVFVPLLLIFNNVPYVCGQAKSTTASPTTTVSSAIMQTLGGVQNSPGFIVVFRPSGIAALAQSFGQLIDTELPKITLQKADIPLPLLTNGIYSVQQIKITSYTPAKSHSLTILPNDRLNWFSREFSFVSNGTFAARIFQLLGVPQQAAGNVGVKATGASVNLTMVMNAGQGGQPTITVENCTATTQSASLDMKVAGVFGQLLDFLKTKPQDPTPLVNQIMCDTAIYYADTVVNQMFRLSPINATFVEDASKTVVNGYPDLSTNDLVFNYGLKDARALKVPQQSSTVMGYILDDVGEISWRNQGGTGFNPPTVDVSVPSNSQVDIYVTDYVVNSLLYHAYAHKLLDFSATEKNNTMKPHLLAACSVGKNGATVAAVDPCLGNYLTELAKRYVGQAVQMDLVTSSAPYVIFDQTAKNILRSSFVVNFLGKLSGKLQTFLSMNFDAQSRLFFNVNNNGTLSGNVVIQNLTVTKVNQNSLSGDGNVVKNNATQFVKILLEKKINERLSRGYVLSGDQVFVPLMNQQKPNITYGPRYARISSNLTIDQTKLTKLAERALANVGSST